MPKKKVIKKKRVSRKDILREEKKIESLERKQLKELEELEELEKKILKQTKPHTLRKVTYRDITKAVIGAFIGIVAHFAFLEGVHLSESIDMGRAISILIVSYFIGGGLLYVTGFRKVKTVKVFKFIPLRLTVIYFTAIGVILFVLFLFGIVGTEAHFEEVFKQVAVISVPAIIGASAADLLGH